MKNKEGQIRCFRPHLKKFRLDIQNLSVIIFNDITEELEKISSLEDKASTDALTGLYNKGKFDDIFAKEIDLADSLKTPLSLIFLDIDHFKLVNDTYGHDIGDFILKELSEILISNVRQGDFVARWGGKEFAITLQSTTEHQAIILAEKIRQSVQDHHFTSGGKQTISLGVTAYRYGETQSMFLKRADEALYEAKSSGRNLVSLK